MLTGLFFALSATFLSQPHVEEMALFEWGSVRFLAPTKWSLVKKPDGKEEEAKATRWEARFDTPEGDAFIDIGIVELSPFQSPHKCLEEMIQMIQKAELLGWHNISIDGQPAARWMGTTPGDPDRLPSAEEAEQLALGKTIDTRVTEIGLMGCNGARKWVLRMSAKTRDAAKYGPTFRRLRESFKYLINTRP